MSSERQQITDLTRRLVEIPSETGREKEAVDIFNLVDEYLGKSTNLESITFEGKNPADKGTYKSRLWGDHSTLMEPKLLLCGHIDVVSVPKDKQYLYSARVEKNKMFGRGTSDMKGGVASMLRAFKRRITEEGSPNGVALLLTSDEEHGGFGGASHLVTNEGLKPSVIFIPDGDNSSYGIIDNQKAPHHFRVVASGPGGHASRAFEIYNPLDAIIKVYLTMQGKYAKATKEDDWKSTFEMTVIESSSKSKNQISSTAEAWFSWRWPIEDFLLEEGREDMRKACELTPGVKLVEEEGFGDMCKVDDINAPFVTIWKGIIQDVANVEAPFKHMHGATDGRHFYREGFKQVLVTSGIGDGAHSDNEWVDIDSLVKLSEAIYKYQKEMTK